LKKRKITCHESAGTNRPVTSAQHSKRTKTRRKKKLKLSQTKKIELEEGGVVLITAVLDKTLSLQSYFKVDVENIIINANDIFRKLSTITARKNKTENSSEISPPDTL